MTTSKQSEVKPGTKQYGSVQEMLNSTLGKSDIAAKTIHHRINSRRLVKKLIVARSQAKLSQADLAKRLDCSQSRISKIENGTDDQLRITDLRAYSRALETGIIFSIGEPKRHAVESIKHHAFQIKHHLDQLAALAQKDEQISTGVEDFFSETLFNMIKIVEDSSRKLPNIGETEEDIHIYSQSEGKETETALA
jgi:transcriptional regulator with XRE-family HTH domain